MTEASKHAQATVDALRRALADAGPVEGIVLLSLIDRAACLVSGINTLAQAMEEAKHG